MANIDYESNSYFVHVPDRIEKTLLALIKKYIRTSRNRKMNIITDG